MVDTAKGVVREPGRETPIAAKVDVAVAGGGPGGIGAAIGAARQGAKTLLIERNAFMGGGATAVAMNTWNVPLENMSGLAREMADRLIERGAAKASVTFPFEAEGLKDLAMDMLLEAGAEPLLYSWVVEPLMEGDTVRGVIVQNKSGRQAIVANVVIDATGDGDLAEGAGVPTVKGRESDGKMRPVTVLFRLGGVDVARIVEYARAHPDQFTADPNFQVLQPEQGVVRTSGFFDLVAEGRQRGEIEGDINYLRFEGIQVARGIVTVNNSRVYGVDGTDAWALTRAEIEARRQNRLLYQFIKKYVPGCENAYVIDTAANIGVRETRRIRGEHVLVEPDIVGKRRYPDSIARIWRFYAEGESRERHSPDGGEGAAGNLIYRTQTTYTFPFEIPYGVLVPQKVEQLMVAGHIISQTHEAEMWSRGQFSCLLLGQAAGSAAAISTRDGVSPRKVDVAKVQQALVAQGVDIGEAAAPLAPAR